MEFRIRIISLIVVFGFSIMSFSQNWQWGRQAVLGGNANPLMEGSSIGTDSKGNAYFTGGFDGTVPISFGAVTISPSSNGKMRAYLVKYDPNGNVLWATTSGANSGHCMSYSCVTDTADNVYIAGYFQDSVLFGVNTLRFNAPEHGFIVKYNSSGSLLWAKSIIGFHTIYSMSTDKSGYLYVTGTSPFFLTKYDLDGNVQWEKEADATSGGWSVATDGTGNIYAAGEFNVSTLTIGAVILNKTTTSGLGDDAFLVKYDNAGNVLWAKDVVNNAAISIIATDVTGNVYLTNNFYSPSVAIGSSTYTNTGYCGIYLIKYNPAGTILWSKGTNGKQFNSAGGLVCDKQKNVYWTGGFGLDLNYDPITFGGSYTFSRKDTMADPAFIVKYDSAGTVLCASVLPSGGDDNLPVANAPAGSVYIGGDFKAKFHDQWWGGLSDTLVFTLGPDTMQQATPGDDSEIAFLGRYKCNCTPIEVNPSQPLICSGGSTTLTASGGANYTWSPSTNLSSTTGVSIVANPTLTTVYTLADTSSQYCPLNFKVFVVTPLAISVSANSTVCFGKNAILSASGGNTYTWSPSTGLNDITGSNITASPVATTTYTVTGLNSLCGTSTVKTVSVYILPLPTLNVSSEVSICAGYIATLTASGAVSYSWAPLSGLNTVTGSMVDASPAATKNYTVTGSDGHCQNSSVITVIVNLLPSVHISTGQNTTIHIGESASLIASGGITYVWNPSTDLSCSDCSNPVADPKETTKYYVTVTNSNGCVNTDSVTVFVVDAPCNSNNALFVPNSFTPNGDGKNDVFYLNSAPDCIKEIIFIIYNRWGEKIFESNNINRGWDGTYKGQRVEEDVYIWKANTQDYSDQNHEYTGRITIVR